MLKPITFVQPARESLALVTHRARPASPCPCSGSRPSSPYALVASFLTRYVDAAPLARRQAAGRDELSRLLEVEVTEAGYRTLIAPMFYRLDVENERPSDDEISCHARWWLDQLP